MNAPGTIRTCGLCLRRAALYPLSYGRVFQAGSGLAHIMVVQLLQSLALEGWSVLAIGSAEGDERLRCVSVQSQG